MKKLSLCLAMVLALVGCGDKASEPATNTNTTQQTTPSQAPATPSQASDNSNLPANAPVIKVAASGNLPPFEYLDEQGNPTGIEVDIVRAIGENQGFKVEFYKESFSDLMTTLEAGKYQATISHAVSTPERALKFDHTISYFDDPNVILFDPSLPISDVNSLKSYRVAMLRNSTQEKFAKDASLTYETEPTTFMLIAGLAQGKYDAILTKKYMAEHILTGQSHYKNKQMLHKF